jgi:hypothetical protein
MLQDFIVFAIIKDIVEPKKRGIERGIKPLGLRIHSPMFFMYT